MDREAFRVEINELAARLERDGMRGAVENLVIRHIAEPPGYVIEDIQFKAQMINES